jgi:hypothetical protein
MREALVDKIRRAPALTLGAVIRWQEKECEKHLSIRSGGPPR